MREQLAGFDAARHLRGKKVAEAGFAKAGVVTRQGNDGGGGLAAFADHEAADSGARRRGIRA